MGFFSWNCKKCGHPLLSEYAANSINDWMQKGLLIKPDGSIVKGLYDGYGRLSGVDINKDADDSSIYHEDCWEAAATPGFDGPSEYADDQGYFFEDEHDMPSPLTKRGKVRKKQ